MHLFISYVSTKIKNSYGLYDVSKQKLHYLKQK